MMDVNANQFNLYVNLQKVKMDWRLVILNLFFLQKSYAINVGIGISDITGPAAEVGMVGFTYMGFQMIYYLFQISFMKLANIAKS